MPTLEVKKKSIINMVFYLLIAAVIILLTIVLFRYVFVWLAPFVIGIIIAALLQKPADFLARKTKAPKSFWAIFLVLKVFICLGGLIALAFFWLYVEISRYVTNVLPSQVENISEIFGDLQYSFQNRIDGLPFNLDGIFAGMFDNLTADFASTFGEFLRNIGVYVITNLPMFLVNLVVAIIATCFIAKDWDDVKKFARRQFSAERWDMLVEVKNLFKNNIFKVFKGYMIIMFITFCQLAVGFLLLDIEYAIAIAALVAILDALPVLGVGTVLLPWSVIGFINGDVFIGVAMIVLYLIIFVARNILEPRIIGKQMGLSPLLALFAMFLGLQLFGLLGMIIFPVIFMIIKSLQDSGRVKLWK